VSEGVEDRLRALGHELPAVLEPAGSYVPAAHAGSFLFTAGQLPFKEEQLLYTGKVGREVSVEDAKEAARPCALNALVAVKAEAGSFENVAPRREGHRLRSLRRGLQRPVRGDERGF
jgi:enamine deaminase RidA (YjgF/YER057c/UK114 family)